MESPLDRIYRQTLPPQRWKFAGWLLLTYAIGYLHAAARPWILGLIPNQSLRELYVRITTTVLVTCTITIIGGLVAAYYFALRERRIHTSMTEFGLAVRATIAGIVGLGGFVLILAVNEGSLLPR